MRVRLHHTSLLLGLLFTGLLPLTPLASPTLAADPEAQPAIPAERLLAALLVAEAHLASAAPALALEILEPLSHRVPDDPIVALRYGEALHGTGRHSEAISVLEIAARDPSVLSDAEFLSARAHALSGDIRAAVRSIDRAWQGGFRDLDRVRDEPDLVSLQDDPHFLFLIERFQDSLTPFRDEVEVFHSFEGRVAHEQFGWAAIEAGDIDGDGANDAAVSAPFARKDQGEQHAGSAELGRVELRSGRSGKLIHEFWGVVPGGRFGTALGKAGDLNGDGVGDIIVGAPGDSESAGRISVHSGADGSTILERTSTEAGDLFGMEARGIGDWNGDGVPDLLVGAPGADGPAGVDAGRVELLSGRDLSLLMTFDGEREGEGLGRAAWGAARHDGHFLALGAGGGGPEGRGEVRLYRGESARLLEVIEADRSGVSLGSSCVSLVGDVDADGVPDFSISDWQNRARGKMTGRVVIHSGANGERLRVFTGGYGSGFGTGDGIAGDVDLDGHADLVIGSWLSSRSASGGGAVFLISGATGEVFATWSGRTVGDHVGFDATGLGDVDGDGALDFLISAANSSIRGPDTGRVFIVSGPCLLQGEFPGNLSGETRVTRP